MRGPRLTPCEAPLPLLRGKNGTGLISLRKAQDNDTDALKVQSIKFLNHYHSAQRSLRLLLPSTQKRSVTRNCWNRTWMAGTGLSIFAGKSTENVLAEYLTKHMAYVFNKFHMCFVLSVLKNQPHSSYVCRRKVVKAQREDHVAIQWRF